MTTTLLKFGKGNAKLNTAIATFSLPSGYTCPFASACKSFADKLTGTIKDAGGNLFRCFSASQECVYPQVRAQRWHNFNLLQSVSDMAQLINASLLKQDYIRVHVAGDFFSQDYFDAWMKVATLNPSKTFYAYTKSIPYWVARLGTIPANFKLTASFGGLHDELIEKNNLISAKVVFSTQAAKDLGLEIDTDDSHAILNTKSFALLIHGTQPKGSEASKAWQNVKKNEGGGYSK